MLIPVTCRPPAAEIRTLKWHCWYQNHFKYQWQLPLLTGTTILCLCQYRAQGHHFNIMSSSFYLALVTLAACTSNINPPIPALAATSGVKLRETKELVECIFAHFFREELFKFSPQPLVPLTYTSTSTGCLVHGN